MRITIIGSGNVGGAVARGASRVGHDVVLSAQDIAQAETVAGQVGGRAVGDMADAASEAEIIVLAVPYDSVADVARALVDVSPGKIVIDATNPLNADATDLVVSEHSGAEEVAALLPAARVVKAFNTVLAANQDAPVTDGIVLDGFYAGDDEGAKGAVRDLLTGIGFRPIDVGPLARARALEQMALLNITLNAHNDWPWKSGWKLVGPTS